VHSTVAQERAHDPEPAVAAAPALARAPAAALHSLPRGVGNRAVARFVGPAVRKARFRALIGSEAAAKGQFLFNGKVADLLYPKVNAAIANEPALAEIFAEWQAGMWPDKGRPDYAKADAARAELKDTKFPAELLGPDDARLEVGARVFETLWKQYSDPKKGFPDLTPYVNLAHFQALARYELIACKRTAALIAGRYVAGGGNGGSRSAATAIKPTQLIGSVKTDMAVFGDDLALGTVATYSGTLGKEVERMKRAIDDGWVIHARVLSGIEGGGKSRAETEHSIVVYGYSGNEFEYFDPDVGGSNVAQTGFDRLHYDPKANRLSTAASEADFAVYAHYKDAVPGHIRGYQASGVHRYQVSSIETL
jgi:hypothetical protein